MAGSGKHDLETSVNTARKPTTPRRRIWRMVIVVTAVCRSAVMKDRSRSMTTTDQAAGLFMLGLIYALVLVWPAFGSAGAGYGSGFFLDVGIPGLAFWPAAGAALAFGHRRIGRRVGRAILHAQ
jgi:hypothetical protein